MGGLSIWHWAIVLLVVVLIFGTKKLRNIGQDLGGAVKGFKDGMKTGEDDNRFLHHMFFGAGVAIMFPTTVKRTP